MWTGTTEESESGDVSSCGVAAAAAAPSVGGLDIVSLLPPTLIMGIISKDFTAADGVNKPGAGQCTTDPAGGSFVNIDSKKLVRMSWLDKEYIYLPQSWFSAKFLDAKYCIQIIFKILNHDPLPSSTIFSKISQNCSLALQIIANLREIFKLPSQTKKNCCCNSSPSWTPTFAWFLSMVILLILSYFTYLQKSSKYSTIG